MQAHGADPISWSTLQPGLSYFETSFGYVAYQRAAGFQLTLGPPICAPADREEMVRRFLSAAPRPLFFYLQEDAARLAAGLGGARFHLCGMGIDKVLPLSSGSAQPVHPRVTGALKKAARARFEVAEVRPSELGAEDRARLEAITRGYLRRSAVPVEMRFLNRPFQVDAGSGLERTFVLRQGADCRVFGYVALDPYFASGQVAGYLLNLIRFEPTRLWGVYYSAVAGLVGLLQGEGRRELSLGFCPLVEVDTHGCSPPLARQVRWMERRFGEVAYLARLRELKEAFPGLTPQRYFVTPSRWVAPAVLAVVRACGVPLLWMLGPQLLRSLLPTRGR